MNAVNRIVMILLSLVTFAFGVISLLLLAGILQPIWVSPAGALMSQWQWIARLQGADKITGWIVFGALTLAGVLFLFLEWIGRSSTKREPDAYVVRQDGLGQVRVARKSVRDLVQHEAATVPGVVEVRPEVRKEAEGIAVYTHTSLTPEAEATTVGQQLQEQIQRSVQQHIGLHVSKVQVTTQIEPLDGKGHRRVR